MKKFFLLITFFLLANIVFSQGSFGEGPNLHFFAYRITTTNYGVGEFYKVYAPGGKIKSAQKMSRNNFMVESQGFRKSNANLRKENFFTKHKVIDSLKIMGSVLNSFDNSIRSTDEQLYQYKKNTRYKNHVNHLANEYINDLWKLRYSIYPYANQGSDSLGYTMNKDNKFMPTDAQMQILSQYGITEINQYIWGDNLFKLLADMRKPEWVEAYKNAQ